MLFALDRSTLVRNIKIWEIGVFGDDWPLNSLLGRDTGACSHHFVQMASCPGLEFFSCF